jgi:hypothetical protein
VTENKPMMLYTATYDSVSAAVTDLDAIEQLHKDQAIGTYDAAVIDKENGKPHVAKRMDRPGVRVVPEWFGGGTLPRKELREAAQERNALVPDDSDVIASTSGSTVTLIGHVRTKAERSAAVGAAWMGHGVEVVVDELEVTG